MKRETVELRFTRKQAEKILEMLQWLDGDHHGVRKPNWLHEARYRLTAAIISALDQGEFR